jgi:hypothetical protein
MSIENEAATARQAIDAAMRRLHEVIGAGPSRPRMPFRCEPVQGRSFGLARHADSRRTALREASYIRRTKLYFGGAEHAFTDRGRDLRFLTTITPPSAPAWVDEPHLRWGKADEAIGAAGADPFHIRAWHVCADLPVAISEGAWMDESKLLVQLALPVAAVVDIAGHTPVDKPPHAHLLIANRFVVGEAYGDEIPKLREAIEGDLRELWLAWLSAS